MTWLTYEVPAGKLSIQIPPVPEAAGGEGSSGGAGFTSPLPLEIAHEHLLQVIRETRHPRDGVWYCTEAEH